MDRPHTFTVLLLPITFSLLSGQGPDTLWTRAYGGDSVDLAYSVQQTTDGGYIAVGYTRSFGLGGSDIWLLKLYANGDTAWTRLIGGIYDDEGRDVEQTSDGGYIITGFIDTMADWGKLCLIKTDANGITTWIKQYRTPDGPAEGYAVEQTTDGGYIVTGKAGHTAPSGSDYIWLLKTDANGDTIWCREWGYPEWSSWGADVQETRDGGYILTGTIVLPSTYYYNDISLIKTNSSGGAGWTRTYGDSAVNDYGYSVEESPFGGHIAVGQRSGNGYILRTDANGDSLWARIYGGSEYRSVSITADSGYIITGCRNYNLYLIRMDESGDTLWVKEYGGVNTDGGYSVEQTTDDGYIIGGFTYSYGAGSSDVYLVKTEPEPGIVEMLGNSLKQIYGSTIISGPLRLPEGKECRVFDVSGREMRPDRVRPGIYFIEVEGKITQKVVKIQ
ncbi:MAG TPA: hypothetical protein EYP58_02365 [bacterium (Candidatus Stahlbacteria)]|nr:hypothetical protein [Candidatus Stahlbacteria bacterium]